MSYSQSAHGRNLVRVAVAAVLGTTVMFSSVPYAAAADEEEVVELEEVQVTGSRIRRPNLEASSPLIAVTAEQLETRSGLNVESYLNQLPNFNPAATPVTTQQD